MKGICTNLDCPKFNENGKTVQDIPDGEDFVCPECGHKLHEIRGKDVNEITKKFKMSLIISAAVLVVAVVLILLFGKDTTPVPPPIPDGSTKVVANAVKPIEQPTPISQNKDTVYIVKDTTIYKTDTVVREKKTVREMETTVVKQVPVKTAATKTYSFGSYSGSLNNGIPEGDGTMTYTSRVQIAKHDKDNPPHYAEAGDKFVGSWGNGDIVSGALYCKDGTIKEKILAPKRFNAYDLSKD